MIKRVIFDIDDTLLISAPYFRICIEKVLINYPKISKRVIDEIDNSFSLYEKTYSQYDYETYVKFFNNNFTPIMTKELFAEINNSFFINAPNTLQDNIIEVLEYLQSKYDLVALTNYISDTQLPRLESQNILKYFSKVYCGDKIPFKPSKESYLTSLGKFNKKECLIIGNDFEKDYQIPKSMGIKAILFDKNNEFPDEKERITNLIELKQLL